MRLQALRMERPAGLMRSQGRPGRLAATVYRPQSARGKLRLFAVRYLSATFLIEDVAAPAVVDSVLDSLRLGFHLPAQAGLALLRSSRPDRWIIGVADSTRPFLVCKAGDSRDLALDNESRFSKMSLSGAQWRSARLRLDANAAACRLLAFDWISGRATTDTRRVYEICHDLAEREIVHGDLAPWNVLSDDSRSHLLDWETARDQVVEPGCDFIHFVVKHSMLTLRVPAQQAYQRLIEDPWLRRLCEPHGLSPHEAVRRYLDADHVGDESAQASNYRFELTGLCPVPGGAVS